MSNKTVNGSGLLMATTHHKAFEKTIRSLCGRRELWRIFSDFCEMGALSFSQVVQKDPKREERYLEIVKGYDKSEVARFPELLGITMQVLSEGERDFLGEIFMGLDLGSHWHGQYFTPSPVCRMMGAMTATDIGENLKQNDFCTVGEPCIGSGAMVIGLAAAIRNKGINYQQAIHVTGVDISPTAVQMAMIQLSLLHIPALIYVGNSLANHWDSVWATPAHHLGLWDYKLRRKREEERQAVESTTEVRPDPHLEPAGMTPTDPDRVPADLFDALMPAADPQSSFAKTHTEDPEVKAPAFTFKKKAPAVPLEQLSFLK